jgi:hypothetical protein
MMYALDYVARNRKSRGVGVASCVTGSEPKFGVNLMLTSIVRHE